MLVWVLMCGRYLWLMVMVSVLNSANLWIYRRAMSIWRMKYACDHAVANWASVNGASDRKKSVMSKSAIYDNKVCEIYFIEVDRMEQIAWIPMFNLLSELKLNFTRNSMMLHDVDIWNNLPISYLNNWKHPVVTAQYDIIPAHWSSRFK